MCVDLRNNKINKKDTVVFSLTSKEVIGDCLIGVVVDITEFYICIVEHKYLHEFRKKKFPPKVHNLLKTESMKILVVPWEFGYSIGNPGRPGKDEYGNCEVCKHSKYPCGH